MQTELNYDTVFDAQQHFRLLLDSMSRPGKINRFPDTEIYPPEGLNHAGALGGFALLNQDATYFVAGENSENIGQYLLVNTGSHREEIAKADYIFLPEGYGADLLEEARTGTPAYPEVSATLIICVELISSEPHENAIAITLKGPGVNGEAKVFISGLSTELLDFVKGKNEEYPLGIDLIITDSDNHLVCIPRSNKFTYTKEAQILKDL